MAVPTNDRSYLFAGLAIGVVVGAMGLTAIQAVVAEAWGKEPPHPIVRWLVASLILLGAVPVILQVYWTFYLPRPARFLRQQALAYFLAMGVAFAGGLVLEVGLDIPGGNLRIQKDGAGWTGTILGLGLLLSSLICTLRYRDDYRSDLNATNKLPPS